MATVTRHYKAINTTPSTTSRTLLYTSPANTQGFVIGGTLANLDTVGHLAHYFTLEKEVSGSFYPIAVESYIPYGASTVFNTTITLNPTDKLHITVGTASKISVNLSITEREEV